MFSRISVSPDSFLLGDKCISLRTAAPGTTGAALSKSSPGSLSAADWPGVVSVEVKSFVSDSGKSEGDEEEPLQLNPMYLFG